MLSVVSDRVSVDLSICIMFQLLKDLTVFGMQAHLLNTWVNFVGRISRSRITEQESMYVSCSLFRLLIFHAVYPDCGWSALTERQSCFSVAVGIQAQEGRTERKKASNY